MCYCVSGDLSEDVVHNDSCHLAYIQLDRLQIKVGSLKHRKVHNSETCSVDY